MASLIESLNAHLNVTKKVLKGQTDVSRGVLDMNPTDGLVIALALKLPCVMKQNWKSYCFFPPLSS